MRFLGGLRVSPRLDWLDEARLVFFTAWKIIFSDRSLDSLSLRCVSFCLTYRSRFIIRSLLNIGLFGARHAIFCWCNNCLGRFSLVDYSDIRCLRSLRLTSHSTNWSWHLFRSRLFLALVTAIEVTARFLFCWNCSLGCPFDCFLDSWRMFGRALLRVRVGATYFFIETDDMAHAFF